MSSDHIHTGGWFNWSHNAAFGNTITISSRSGYFLVAFLTLYVTIAGSRFWVIMAFIVHQEITNSKEYDGMHIQQQAILRNSEAPMSAAVSLARIAFRWRGVAKRPLLRSLPLLLLALSSLGAFRAASILTAEVTKAAGNETLIDSPGCSYWAPSSEDPLNQGGFRTKVAADALAAASYSRACYSTNSTASTQCGAYMARKLGWNGTSGVHCPFSPSLCFPSLSAVYQMDTGQLNSHFDLGLNAQEEDRVAYRRLTTCAPINATKFLSTGPDGSGNTYYNYSLGNIQDLYPGNLSFIYNDHSVSDRISYQLTAFSPDVSANWTSEIQTIPAEQADITIAFISANSVVFDVSNTDLIFGATKSTVRRQRGKDQTFYLPDNFVTVLGCVDQHQFCRPSTSQCSSLSRVRTLRESTQGLNLNSKQNAAVRYIWNAIYYNNIYWTIGPRGAASLRASESVYQYLQHELSNTQWITEVQGWFDASLARLQQAMVEIAMGPSSQNPGINYTRPGSDPQNSFEENLCRTQILRSTGKYQNFSVLGIAIIVAFSSFFIWLSFMIGTATGWVQRWIHKGEDRRLQWLLDDSLQLQRMAYAGASEGTWHDNPEEIPITHESALLKASLYLPANRAALRDTDQPQTPKHG
ncbi:uncharacterized protein BDR25DRAFT_271861 [Lindgomyces ingoldianus]|uniref:Uncharacterized protein n=1 Tax=Lindgomyces ingoldianus TaxID=673940 RepID=A0ACB6QD19_9PLEO|nr:uncharacterized protein BDR25DRAFT_271861 [Lindgomyces ingoldianus]KAF2464395.1 hypothetical protein BDR25DRAFT_271861 [Lindgomyces ingoldianus]